MKKNTMISLLGWGLGGVAVYYLVKKAGDAVANRVIQGPRVNGLGDDALQIATQISNASNTLQQLCALFNNIVNSDPGITTDYGSDRQGGSASDPLYAYYQTTQSFFSNIQAIMGTPEAQYLINSKSAGKVPCNFPNVKDFKKVYLQSTDSTTSYGEQALDVKDFVQSRLKPCCDAVTQLIGQAEVEILEKQTAKLLKEEEAVFNAAVTFVKKTNQSVKEMASGPISSIIQATTSVTTIHCPDGRTIKTRVPKGVTPDQAIQMKCFKNILCPNGYTPHDASVPSNLSYQQAIKSGKYCFPADVAPAGQPAQGVQILDPNTPKECHCPSGILTVASTTDCAAIGCSDQGPASPSEPVSQGPPATQYMTVPCQNGNVTVPSTYTPAQIDALCTQLELSTTPPQPPGTPIQILPPTPPAPQQPVLPVNQFFPCPNGGQVWANVTSSAALIASLCSAQEPPQGAYPTCNGVQLAGGYVCCSCPSGTLTSGGKSQFISYEKCDSYDVDTICLKQFYIPPPENNPPGGPPPPPPPPNQITTGVFGLGAMRDTSDGTNALLLIGAGALLWALSRKTKNR